MKTIYVVRHGEAEINPTAEKPAIHIKGASAELTPRGHIQAAKIAERATQLPIEAIIASTMVRAQQTVTAISRRVKLPFESSDLIVERTEPTSLVGQEWLDEKVQRRFREWEEAFVMDRRIEDGEIFSDVHARAKSTLALLEQRVENHILLVTHGYFMRVVLGHILFGEKSSPEMVEPLHKGLKAANTGLTILHYDPSAPQPWYVSVWNDHAHLAD